MAQHPAPGFILSLPLLMEGCCCTGLWCPPNRALGLIPLAPALESKFQLQTALKWEELHLVGGQQELRKAAVLHRVEKKAVRTNGRTQITIIHLRNLWFPPKTCHNTSKKNSQTQLERKWLSLAKAVPLVHYVLTITPPFKRYSAKQAVLVNCFITGHCCWSLSSPLSSCVRIVIFMRSAAIKL